MSIHSYPGQELELFAGARNWKRYLRAQLRPYLRGRVLEVGAGLGGTTSALHGPEILEWVCLEPDCALADRLVRRIHAGELPRSVRVVPAALDSVSDRGFDAVLYIDVLEHIDDDADELARAAERLVPGGHLVVLAPAHPWLFSPFDAAIGHRRRYTRSTLARAAPAGLRTERLCYLDSMGLLASAGNRLLLRAAHPTPRQIRFWDGLLVRASGRFDRWTGYRLGKSVLGIWQRP